MIRVGMDLGADRIRLVTAKDGVLFDELCMVALDRKGNVLAIGNEAQEMQDTFDDSIRIIRPLAGNQIDFEALHALIEQLIYDFKLLRMFKKTVLLFSYPTSLTSKQCEELKEHLLAFGAYRVYFDQEIWVAAIGAKLNLFIPVASCVLNLGSSNCDIALFMDGAMLSKSQYKVAGSHIDLLIKRWARQCYQLKITDEEAQSIKETIGSTRLEENPRTMSIQGLHAAKDTLETVQIDSNQIAVLLRPVVEQWANWIAGFIQTLNSDQQEDVRTRGIICCGGTMLLRGLQRSLQELVGCPVYVTDDPINTVAEGLEIVLTRMEE